MHHSSNYYIKCYCVHAIAFNVLLLLPFSSAIVLYVCLLCFYCGGAEIKDTDTDYKLLYIALSLEYFRRRLAGKYNK